MNNQLSHILKEWDGTHIDYLNSIYDQYYKEPSFFITLIEITSNNTSLQTSATWLIKHHYDQKRNLPQNLIDLLLNTSLTLKDWEAKLHILQLLPKVSITKETLNIIDQFIRKCLKDDVKFVRAWAFQGFYEVVQLIPEYEQELRILCDIAMQTESASVKSRVKKVLTILNKKVK
ncbi:hypothetical protein [Aquimarina sp. 2201CG5-10]|uniref:hypothetical protein n=1 Tax=Aquimarina callyspongiae TaxID=3098150 RepID=UPI002AB3BF23|nr:hypothetical protein [Aquimarina sp. 2201CG5-10]MDY8134058.1 hypothetical protein [Aquimarina sp. 2201CG5-10]